MPKAYSEDMRARVIAEVESGASRRAAAEEFDVSASTAIIWLPHSVGSFAPNSERKDEAPSLRPPARQHQGPEVVVRSVRASSISAIAIMTNAVEANRILGSPRS